MTEKIKKQKGIIKIIGFVVLIVISLILSQFLSNPENLKGIIDIIDDYKQQALTISASSTAVSVSVSALAKDAGEPIADILTDMTSYIVIIMAVLFLEKFLLTTIMQVSFGVLIPVSCAIGIINIFAKNEKLKSIYQKVIIFSIALSMVIPLSAKLGKYIEETHKVSIATEAITEEEVIEEDTSFWEKFKGKTSELKDYAEDRLNYFIDSIAVLLITTCAIPVGALAFMMWLVKFLFGFSAKIPDRVKIPKKEKDKIQTEVQNN